MTVNLVKVDTIKKEYSGRMILNGISFSIIKNEILAIIGPNGTGKTTTVEIILGMRGPDSGSIYLNKIDRKRDMGAQLQNTPFFYNLTVEENIRLFCNFYQLKNRTDIINEVIKLFDLESVKKANVYSLSGGQKKRLSIALATLHNPKIIFLDEPTANLDPRGRMKVRKIIQHLAARGHSVVFTSHDMNEVVKIAHRVLIFVNGKIIDSGNPQELIEKYGVQSLEDVYLLLTEK